MEWNSLRRVGAATATVLLLLGAQAVPAAASGLREQQATVAGPSCGRQSDAVRIGVSPGATIGALSPADLDRELTLARDAGSFAVRLDIDWSALESTRGRFDWSRTDRVIDAVVAQGMCVHGIIAYTPRWARVAGAVNDSHSRPANPSTFAAFAKTVVQRYQSRIKIWEVWNEPNIVTFFKPVPDVAAYSALLRATYTVIKQVQPDSTVLAGGMAPAEDKDGNIAGTTFLSKMYAQGSNKYFDAFNVHPYTWPYLPNDPDTASWNTAMKMWSMRDTMIAGGDSGKQIWITEFGAPTGTAPNSVSEQVQSDSIGIVLDAVLGNDWLGPAYVYSLRDAGTDTADTEQNFGLVQRDWTPKIAYGRVDAYAAEHSGR